MIVPTAIAEAGVPVVRGRLLTVVAATVSVALGKVPTVVANPVTAGTLLAGVATTVELAPQAVNVTNPIKNPVVVRQAVTISLPITSSLLFPICYYAHSEAKSA